MKVLLCGMIAALSCSSCSSCGKTTAPPAPDASVALIAPVAFWPPSSFERVRPCVTSTVIDRAKIAPYLDIEDELDSNAIVAMGESAVAPLVDLTRTGRHQERALATSVLGHFACREAAAQLETLLWDADETIRLHAVVAFGRSQGSAATPQLSRMLGDGDEVGVVKLAIMELDRIGDARAIAPLQAFRASTPRGWLRERADAAIAAIGKREADAGDGGDAR